MRAVLLKHRGPDGAVVTEVPRPALKEGHVVIRMLAASVNRVDLYMRDNGAGITHTLPQIMGVDGVGEVAEANPDSNFKPGDRVILYPYEFCGACRYCLAGDQTLCLSARIFGEHRDGTMAEYLLAPEVSVLRLSDKVDIDGAATL
ncbi:alcohol dehydrogenase catalytic domain-containing protein, partial [Actibacterium sp.]|uniref:alcohol dehydrogenase catalytic domain-containing protein n=1 Tax=Actibacterium sp. TaxID=1872125 RepID=UPI003565E6C6